MSDETDGSGKPSAGEIAAEAVILDLDGTLVDSNYQHVIAWQQAFRRSGFQVDAWRIHRSIGAGGDQIVQALLGSDAERQHGDAIRADETEVFAELLPQVRPFEGASSLIRELKEDGFSPVLASSAKQAEVERYVELLGAEGLHDGYTTADDVDSTKPEPDLVAAAIGKADGRPAVMVGDSVWDVEAAGRAGLKTIAVLSGGFGEAELSGAGASFVVESVDRITTVLCRCPDR